MTVDFVTSVLYHEGASVDALKTKIKKILNKDECKKISLAKRKKRELNIIYHIINTECFEENRELFLDFFSKKYLSVFKTDLFLNFIRKKIPEDVIRKFFLEKNLSYFSTQLFIDNIVTRWKRDVAERVLRAFEKYNCHEKTISELFEFFENWWDESLLYNNIDAFVLKFYNKVLKDWNALLINLHLAKQFAERNAGNMYNTSVFIQLLNVKESGIINLLLFLEDAAVVSNAIGIYWYRWKKKMFLFLALCRLYWDVKLAMAVYRLKDSGVFTDEEITFLVQHAGKYISAHNCEWFINAKIHNENFMDIAREVIDEWKELTVYNITAFAAAKTNGLPYHMFFEPSMQMFEDIKNLLKIEKENLTI